MSTVTSKGKPIEVAGTFPRKGDQAPGFTLVGGDLNDVSLGDFAGQRKILNIVLSLDSRVCAASARKFNDQAERLENTAILVISADLPFTSERFCATEGLNHVRALSTMRGREFLRDYGVEIASGPLVGLCARAVVVVDEKDTVLHAELVSETANEPDYAAAIAALQ